MSRYLLAIDQGTTSSRAIIFDLDGHIIATSQQEFAQIFPKDGWVEHDPETIWKTPVVKQLKKPHCKVKISSQ